MIGLIIHDGCGLSPTLGMILHFLAWSVFLHGLSEEKQKLIQDKFSLNELKQLPDTAIIGRITVLLLQSFAIHEVESATAIIGRNIQTFRAATDSGSSRSEDDDADASDESLVSDWVGIFYH